MCQTADGLEVNGFHDLTCTGCGFIGDVVELYGTIRELTLPVALSDLVADRCVTFSNPLIEEAHYLAQRNYNRTLITIFNQGQKWLAEGASGSIRSILQRHDCLINDQETSKLSRYFGSIRAEDFQEFLESGVCSKDLVKCIKSVLKGLGRYSSLGMACWDGSTLTGMWLIQPECWGVGYAYLPLTEHDVGCGMMKALRIGQDACFVTNDPTVSLRFMVRQLDGERDPVPFLVPPMIVRSCLVVPARQLYFFPLPSTHDWYHSLGVALQFRNALVVPHWNIDFDPRTSWAPKGQTGPKVIRDLIDQSLPAGQALGAYLLTLPVHDATKRAQSISLSVLERNEVLKHFRGQDVHDLRRILDTTSAPTQVTIDGHVITETEDGWLDGDTIISEAIIRIMELKTDTATFRSIASGVVIVKGSQFPFQEELRVLEKKPGEWLKRFCLAHGSWPTISNRWGSRLLDIAKAFSRNTIQIITSDKPFGWGQDGILRFPRFLVDRDGVKSARSDVQGPDIPYPPPYNGHDEQAFLSRDFCMVSLAILGNLIRTGLGKPGRGIAVPSSPHVVERVATALGIRVEQDPTQAVLANAFCPTPIFGVWSDRALGGLMGNPHPKHTFLSVDQKTFQLLAAHQDWVRLPVENMIGYESLRWVFHAVPWFIGQGFTGRDDAGFYRDLAKVASERLELPKPHQTKLREAAQDLDHNWVASGGSSATMFLRLVHYLVDSGDLKVRKTPDGYGFDEQELVLAAASPYLPDLNTKQIRKSLQEAGMLVGVKNGRWEIGETAWILTKTYTRTLSG